jgi:hypothetical protein
VSSVASTPSEKRAYAFELIDWLRLVQGLSTDHIHRLWRAIGKLHSPALSILFDYIHPAQVGLWSIDDLDVCADDRGDRYACHLSSVLQRGYNIFMTFRPDFAWALAHAAIEHLELRNVRQTLVSMAFAPSSMHLSHMKRAILVTLRRIQVTASKGETSSGAFKLLGELLERILPLADPRDASALKTHFLSENYVLRELLHSMSLPTSVVTGIFQQYAIMAETLLIFLLALQSLIRGWLDPFNEDDSKLAAEHVRHWMSMVMPGSFHPTECMVRA